MKRTISSKNLFRVAAVGGASLLVAGLTAPGAVASGDVDGNVKISNTETVQILMNASGKIAAQRVVDQLTLTGNGKVDISNPVSTDALRNLDGFSHYDVRDGKIRVKTDVNGTKKYRSVSNFTKKLPLKIEVHYFLDGKEVQPGQVVGKSGKLEVKYRVTNVTGVAQEVPFKDGLGNEKTETENVVIPMVGSLTTALPSNFTKVKSAEANAGGDGKGGTQLSFNMTLFPPIGKDFVEFGYSAQITNGSIPKATIAALPVNPLESPSFSGGAASYKGGAQSGADLTAGATEIDANLLKLRDGANDLVAGLLQLNAGANKLSAGLNNDAVPGAKKLAAGASKLNAGAGQLQGGTSKLSKGSSDLNAGATKLSRGALDLLAGLGIANDGAKLLFGGVTQVDAGAQAANEGAQKLNKGAGDLSSGAKDLANGASAANQGAGALAAGLSEASAGGPALADGVAQLLTGAQALDAGLATLKGMVVPGADQINGAATSLIAGVTGGINTSLDAALSKIDGAITTVDDSTTMDPGEQSSVLKALRGEPGVPAGAQQYVQGVRAALNDETDPTGFMFGLEAIRDGAAGISAGVAHTTTDAVIDPVDKPTLKYGTVALVAGLTQLQTKAGPLIVGLGKLSAGANALADGTGKLAAGSGQLSAGADQLSAGAGQLSGGTAKLAAGTGSLKTGAGDLSKGLDGKILPGAKQLSGGTGQLAAGTGSLKDGANKLNAGAGALKDGTGQLSAGAGTLADGLGAAASGSGQLADGLNKAADAAPAIPEGADRLSKEGTSKLVESGNKTASDYGLKYAVIEAGATRAGSAQPYGSPEGATELTAYQFELAGADGASSSNAKRGIAAIVLLAIAGAVAVTRRKGIV